MFHPLLKALAEYGKDVLGISWDGGVFHCKLTFECKRISLRCCCLSCLWYM